MATQFNFNGQLIKLPGVYTQTLSGITNPPLELSFGNVLVLDIDPNSNFGGGSGVNGTISQDQDSIYTFDNLRSFRSFVRGGKYWDLSGPLFRPFGPGINGISQLRYVRALTTTPASRVIDLIDSGNGGSFTVRTKHEGLAGNGVIPDETPATQTVTITAIGAASDTIDVIVGGASIGVYVSNGTDSTSDAATALALAITNGSSGYTASANTNVVTVTAIPGDGASANTITFVVTPSGTAAATAGAGTLAGGVDGTLISQGIGFIIENSVADPTKFVLKFFRGTYTGLASVDGLPFDGIAATNTNEELIATSDPFNTYQELKDWMDIDFDFNNNFELQTSSPSGTGVINSTAISAYTTLTVLRGGTQSFATSDLTAALEAVTELDYTFILAPESGSSHSSANNLAILSHITDDARFEKFMVVGGGDEKSTFTTESITAAQSYDNDRVIVIHGGVKVASNITGTGTRDKSSEYKAAFVLGRTAGLEPQIPVTFKGLDFEAERHPLNKAEKELALDSGVLTTAFNGDIGAFVVLQGINSLQRNRNLVNEDGTSHSLQLKRIAAQLNKEIEVNATQQLLGNQTAGPNRNTLVPAVVEEWLRSFLQRRTAIATVDNLILGFQDISVEIVQDAYFIQYAFTPNFEVNKLFFTSLIIDPNL